MMFCFNDMWDEFCVIVDVWRGNVIWSQCFLLLLCKLNWMCEWDKSMGVKLCFLLMEMSIVIIMLLLLRYF